ncbi:g5211 [Coccomyxa viridis]|uniref:G5211 protein n=1 Tax=Coccomyxa viridis TaxID=1274662 RepID=A0ABP1FW80_9CHLO
MSPVEPRERSPIVFIPGLAGSALEAKLDRTDAPAWWCSRKTNGYKRVWFSFSEASKPSCLLDQLALFYDESTGRYRNHDGIEIRAVDFGGLEGIDALHPGLPRLTPMFSKLTQAFKDEGYQERRHLFGAPYDFRLAPDGLEQEGYFADLAELIEGAVASNGGRPATIVAHSLGCLVSLYFIARRSRQWLQKHISGLVAISGPWGGAVSSLKGSISGDSFDVPVIPHNIFRPLQSSAPSGPWMFPAPDMWRDEASPHLP